MRFAGFLLLGSAMPSTANGAAPISFLDCGCLNPPSLIHPIKTLFSLSPSKKSSSSSFLSDVNIARYHHDHAAATSLTAVRGVDISTASVAEEEEVEDAVTHCDGAKESCQIGYGRNTPTNASIDAYSAIELALDSVVKIFTISSSPNYFLPWQNKSQRDSMGSGPLPFPINLLSIYLHVPMIQFKNHNINSDEVF